MEGESRILIASSDEDVGLGAGKTIRDEVLPLTANSSQASSIPH